MDVRTILILLCLAATAHAQTRTDVRAGVTTDGTTDSTAANPSFTYPTAGNFNLGFDRYTYPVYYADQSTGLYPVATERRTNIDGKRIPWNPSWQGAPGTDAQVIILDPAGGRDPQHLGAVVVAVRDPDRRPGGTACGRAELEALVRVDGRRGDRAVGPGVRLEAADEPVGRL
jgi:hypothetical protein